MTFEPHRVEFAQASSSEILELSGTEPTRLCENMHSSGARKQGPYQARYSQTPTSPTSASDEYRSTTEPRFDEYRSTTEPRFVVHPTEDAIHNLPPESLQQHHIFQCEERPQLHGSILLLEMVPYKEKEVEVAGALTSVKATMPCKEMPKSLSKYMDSRQYRKDFGQIAEQDKIHVNGHASEDFDCRYAEFVGRVLPGYGIFYSKKPYQTCREVEGRTGDFRERQNQTLATLPIALYKPTRVHHQAPKRCFLEPEPAINDDYLYPDAVTPTKVEKSLSAVEESKGIKENRYDVPFMDDDAFLPRKLHSPSYTTLITDDETSSELGYSYGYYDGRYTKADHLANEEDEKSNQGTSFLFVSLRNLLASI
ncbi:unnamed protein product [Schistocephalus solidus]|uniref:Uncharacterized protein n=1 Tax=Schistocephalus solidus TaxID=70667 RepID=A0A3P7CT46_SCHSO|nr:unnamed protein product [Schistocephalus solidus]